MKILIKIICTVSVLFAAQSAFACDYPDRVLIPNGGTATKEDMLEGQRGVKTYVAAMEVYLECIVDEEKAAVTAMENMQPEDEQQRADAMNKKYNAAVDEMERLAAQFNAEVQAYKAKGSD
ncbi:MAG: hypothetical protein ACI88G_000872 [Woeseiaceae bacterium]|jgi:hypothetical protein